MAHNEKTPFGVSIEASPEENHLAPSVFDTPKTLSPAISREGTASPQDTRTSNNVYSEQTFLRQQFLNVHNKSSLDVYETDLEAGEQLSPSVTPNGNRLDFTTSPFHCPSAADSRYSVNTKPMECSMWPSRQTLQDKHRAEKTKRKIARSGCWAPVARRWTAMDKRQRLWFKIFVALLISAVAVALGVGISRAVGGGVWASSGQTITIPQDN